jgi:hypothetical protein
MCLLKQHEPHHQKDAEACCFFDIWEKNTIPILIGHKKAMLFSKNFGLL